MTIIEEFVNKCNIIVEEFKLEGFAVVKVRRCKPFVSLVLFNDSTNRTVRALIDCENLSAIFDENQKNLISVYGKIKVHKS